jgi:hypothetical protein
MALLQFAGRHGSGQFCATGDLSPGDRDFAKFVCPFGHGGTHAAVDDDPVLNLDETSRLWTLGSWLSARQEL